MSDNIRLGLVGFGKIARDQHVPAIKKTVGLELVAVASRNAQAEAVVNFPDLDAMLAGVQNLDAIILCMPPQARYTAARAALLAGKRVFLEKPPGATLSEVDALVGLAKAQNVTLYASWHSRYAAAVAAAKQWIATRDIKSVAIVWKEDVRHWHPGQDWIWAPGGFGVFDPGINALSIVTEIMPERLRVRTARLETPRNRQAPIAATLALETASGTRVSVDLDWRQTGPQTWDIVVEAADGTLVLHDGGNGLTIDGQPQSTPPEGEYAAMYKHFLALITSGQSDVDLSPLQLVADAFLCGELIAVEPFVD